MSPLQIEIMLWYYSRVGEYRDGDFRAPAVREAIDQFRGEDNLLTYDQNRNDRTYRLTARGLAYVNCLMSVPLPDCRWVAPILSAEPAT